MDHPSRNNAPSSTAADFKTTTTNAASNWTATGSPATNEVDAAVLPLALRNLMPDLMAVDDTGPIAIPMQPPPAAASPSALNVNGYASKKSLAQGMLDLALLAANAAQLKFVLAAGESHPFYQLLLVLIVTSICLQVSASITRRRMREPTLAIWHYIWHTSARDLDGHAVCMYLGRAGDHMLGAGTDTGHHEGGRAAQGEHHK